MKMSNLLWCLVIVSLFSSAVFASVDLGIAGDYNVFVLGNYTSQGSDIQGRLAAGGSVFLTSYSVGSALGGWDTDTVVTGGSLTYTNGTIYGNSVTGGSTNLTGVDVKGTSTSNVASASLPVDFAAEATYLMSLSTELASLSATGTVSDSYGTITFAGSGISDVEVFNISASDLASAYTLILSDIADDVTVVINVSGTSAAITNCGMQSFDAYSDNVLFNFYEATGLTLSSVNIEGSILACLADVTANNGCMDGTLIAGSCTGGMQFHHVPFESTPETPSVPVPGALMLLSGGLMSLTGLKRKINH